MTIKEFEIQIALGSLSDDVKMRLAVDPNTPKEILVALYALCQDATLDNWTIKIKIARNPNAPIEAYKTLFNKTIKMR